ncbi:MAG: hypothetical protein RIR79_2314 [Pseudomonadota bacterium]|jgi:predicted O-linked N-acetylglucosamine transferase (SPINDLY family)
MNNLFNTLFEQAYTLHKEGKFAQAHALYLQVLAIEPQHFDALRLLGAIRIQTHQPKEAIEWLDKAIAINPNNSDIHGNRGMALVTLQQYPAAIESFDRAIALEPDYVESWNNRGIALDALKQHQAALESYDRAIAFQPLYMEAWSNRAATCQRLKQYQAAIESFDRAIALDPKHPFAHGVRLHTKTHICDWSNVEAETQELIGKIERSETVVQSFPFLSIKDSLALQYQVARMWSQTEHPFNPELGIIPPHPPAKKIRIGYFSTDFRNHAVAQLVAELFENHDKNRFEIIGFAFGVESNDAMRQRLMRAFDQFLDVRHQSDKEVAQLARQLEIDIAVDLNGFTTDSRFGIFAYRAAPIQVSYIGYPGTVGADYMDYIVADKTLIPETAQPFYSEKVVYMPHSYQVNDRKREISDKTFTREALGLPDSGFVFCCFNNNYKITPTTFDGWMRTLHQVPNSVLWLLEDNATAAANLRKEAKARGIEPHRLVFAGRMPLPKHLARHRVADLFIDSLPYNAHTTASDALWAGLPVLTCMGESFASRVAGSLLNAIELPELITKTQAEFEVRAVELALNPEKLQTIRDKLDKNRLTTPLFDSELFTRHLENAYEQMVQRYHAGLPPEHITVNPDAVKIKSNAGLGRYLPPFLSRFLPRSQ